ncbi:hypothetical protein M441DRAFT_336017 [Trichoderma asperellum CBS 433.97]|uniref:Uncharacterized protein n=1 Tax=Trichoderma asperellum (strain ATCC 204424 / CBS 433.97 / NBRC 101777) TaxID=1042311 RepID=A0A2T3ZG52_TRIA4|nr:hypothetical protein M441DRAFT_336017 [Trichoderma asperellum CBS 433.97]PTB43787.1 hypothetical protein M441DRAFT_336017 [Trichoderma asperellum CBS 433.97]
METTCLFLGGKREIQESKRHRLTVARPVLRLTEGCLRVILGHGSLHPYSYGIHRRFGLVYYIDIWRMHTQPDGHITMHQRGTWGSAAAKAGAMIVTSIFSYKQKNILGRYHEGVNWTGCWTGRIDGYATSSCLFFLFSSSSYFFTVFFFLSNGLRNPTGSLFFISFVIWLIIF